MRKHHILLLLLFFFVLSLAAQSTSKPMQQMEERMRNTFMQHPPTTEETQQLLSTLSNQGTFAGLDYTSPYYNAGDTLCAHNQQLALLAKAYTNPQSSYCGDEALYTKIEAALRFWVDANIIDKNGWHRVIGYPKDLIPTLVLMKPTLSQRNAPLWKELLHYLAYSWSNTPPSFTTGANGTDISQITFALAVLSADAPLLREVMERVGSLIYVVEEGIADGIQYDYSFSQHVGHGRQLYLGTYGREYVSGVLFFLEFTNNTPYALSPKHIAIIENLFIHNVMWVCYQGEIDPNQCGRKIVDKHFTPTGIVSSYTQFAKRLYALQTPQAERLRQVIAVLESRQPLLGNRPYPTHDYMVHRTQGAMTTLRMTSTRTVGNEGGNAQGYENYHTGDGATYIKVHGDEYSPIYPYWNWRTIPGTTVVVDTLPMPIPMWGKGGAGGNDFAAVASNGEVGVSGFIFQKDSLMAHKAWFCFENEVVALGCGITTAREDAPVLTTLNQTHRVGEVHWLTPSRLWHNNVGYVVEPNRVTTTTQPIPTGEILSITLAHGTAPQGDSYQYSIVPNTTQADFESFKSSLQVVANTPEVQAVACGERSLLLAIFYKSTTLHLPNNGSLWVDKPVAIILDSSTGEVKATLGNPFGDAHPAPLQFHYKGSNASFRGEATYPQPDYNL